MKKTYKLVLLFFIAIATISCSSDSKDGSPSNSFKVTIDGTNYTGKNIEGGESDGYIVIAASTDAGDFSIAIDPDFIEEGETYEVSDMDIFQFIYINDGEGEFLSEGMIKINKLTDSRFEAEFEYTGDYGTEFTNGEIAVNI